MDEKGYVVEASANSGFNGDFDIMESALQRGEFPFCMRHSLGLDKLAVTQNPMTDCPDCPLSSKYTGRSGLSCRLSYGDRIFGIISVSIPEKFAYDKEEQNLFAELAADLGYALSKLKTDVQVYLLNQIVKSIPQPFSFLSQDYRYLAVNDVYAQLYMTTAENIIGQTPADFFGELVFRKEIKPHLDHVLCGNVVQYEIQVDFPAMDKQWMSMSYFPYCNEQGEVTGVISHGYNITERKWAEEALRTSEWYLRSTLDGLSAHIVVLDDKGEIILTNKAFRDFGMQNGIKPDTVSEGANYLAICDTASGGHSEEAKPFAEGIREVLSGKLRYFELEYPCHSPDEKRWFVGRITPFTGDSPRRVVVAHENITERKLSEEAFKSQNTLLSTIMKTSPVGITRLDVEGNITYANHRAEQILGIEKNKITERKYDSPKWSHTDINGEPLQEEKQPFYIVKKTVKPAYNIQHGMKLPDGRSVILSINASPMSDKEGQFAGIVATFDDITERKQTQAEQKKLQAQLTQVQKMESVGRLAGGVAHDFNNMLGVILGYVEFALEKTEQDHDLHADLKEIQKAAQRSADITKQLLAFARKQIISPRKMDLNDTVETILNMLRRLIGEDIDLVWKPSAHLWPVKMDPSQIDQILANLCVNARDAIAGVGKLTIETGRKSFDEEYCSEHPGFIPGDFVLLAISDNGCGMNKKTLDNLFEPFFTTKEVGKGTGLGLATVYGIVKQNNGFINVYSEPKQGSTFRIYLPRLAAKDDTDMAVPEKKAVIGGTETILLVEDEPSILRMAQMMLERKGYIVISAATPTEAIEKAKNHSSAISLLMTDVVMPEMNGRELAGQITALYPDIKLLFMSGYTANVIARQGVLDEGTNFIQKPFSMADLAENLRKILDTASDKTQD